MFTKTRYFALAAVAALSLTFSATVTFAMGDAGCGLGSVVFSSNKKLHQILAATTNGTFGSQTFGITTGTSNCKASGFAKVEKEQIFYAESNYKNLMTEMAQGRGESLEGFAQVLGCNSASTLDFGKMTQSQYESIFPKADTTAVEMLRSVKQQIQAHPKLAKACGQVG